MSPYSFTQAGTTYDAEDRLTGFARAATSGTPQLSQGWNLSAVGDWNSVTTNGTSQSRTHGPTHELLTAGGQGVTHDTKGNMLFIPASVRANSSPLVLTWDFDNRMVSADVGADSVIDVTHQYDALGRRVARTASGSTTVFVQVDQQTICDYVSGAAPASSTYRYLYASYIDEPIVRVTTSNSETTWYHRNQQYSIVACTDSTGAATEPYAYTAYGLPTITDGSGTVRTSSAIGNRYTYTGREWDGVLGLYHYRARMYEATVGRFCSRDPIAFSLHLSNSFVYVGHSPCSHVDPNGLQKTDPVAKQYCGPEATDLLAEELLYASNFWAQHVRHWTSGWWIRWQHYLDHVRWSHMLQIGPQLDWTDLTSAEFRNEKGLLITCPTKECKKTYRICGTCVHDHFIGNIMFGFWTSLHGIHWMAANAAGHGAQMGGETEDRGLDKPWDQAGYELGRILAAFDRDGTPMNETTVCQILKGNSGNAVGYFTMANQRYSDDYTHCEKCPKGLDGGLRRWAKRFNGGYPAF